MQNSPPTLRVYRPKWGWRIFSLFFPIFGGLAVISELKQLIAQAPDFSLGVLICGLLIMVVGAGLVVNFFTSVVRFTHDSVEHRTLFRRRSLPLAAIRGRREYMTRDSDGVPTYYLRLIPNDNRLPVLEFTRTYALDEAFFRWFYSLPGLNERDEPKSKFSFFGSR
jgi:hypothetical protein